MEQYKTDNKSLLRHNIDIIKNFVNTILNICFNIFKSILNFIALHIIYIIFVIVLFIICDYILKISSNLPLLGSSIQEIRSIYLYPLNYVKKSYYSNKFSNTINNKQLQTLSYDELISFRNKILNSIKNNNIEGVLATSGIDNNNKIDIKNLRVIRGKKRYINTEDLL